MNRVDFQHMPNRPALMLELREDFEPFRHHALGEPSMDASECVPRGSAIAVATDNGQVLTQGHLYRQGWRGRVG
jgi:hypothetical protein